MEDSVLTVFRKSIQVRNEFVYRFTVLLLSAVEFSSFVYRVAAFYEVVLELRFYRRALFRFLVRQVKQPVKEIFHLVSHGIH